MSPVTDIARVFTGDKTIESRALNLAGIQPFRAVAARLLYRLRPGSGDPLMAELARTGVVVCENFLSASEFAELDRETDAFMAESSPTWFERDGTTESRRYHLVKVDEGRFPRLAEWRLGAAVTALASKAERRTDRQIGDGGALIEHLILGDYSEPDGQTTLHVDTFFSTHKMWLYLDDVSAENAAFVYVPGSHLIDSVRLRHDYLESIRSNRKSRPVSDEEVKSRGLERRVFTCSRNSLVLVNTCGYHCRSVGRPGASRRGLHKELRFNPFRAARR